MIKLDIFERQRLVFNKEEMDKIRNAVVLIAGTGGLGTHQAAELQRLGIGKIYLIDDDRVEPGNLNRQIFYGKDSIGKYKVDEAKSFLDKFELETEIVTIRERITEEMELPSDVDMIFDALDNFSTRFVLEKLALGKNIPMVHGGVSSWYGQITTILPGKTPSLQDIFGKNPEQEGKIPVISPVVSVIASLQVVEGIKVLLQKEETLAGKLMLIDLNDYSLEIIEINI